MNELPGPDETSEPAATGGEPPVPGPEGTAPAEGEPSAETLGVVETLVFAAEAPLAVSRLAELTGRSAAAVRAAVDALNRRYEAGGHTFRIHRVAQGYQFYTVPEFAEWVRTMYKRQFIQRLTKPSLEVLAIVAYKQPVTRPEIEKLRGVDCSGPLLTLLERRLIATAGRARRPGSPFLYRTTREFLRYFGLAELEDLPPLEEFGALMDRTMAGEEEEPETAGVSENLAIEYPTTQPDAREPGAGEPPETGPGAPDR